MVRLGWLGVVAFFSLGLGNDRSGVLHWDVVHGPRVLKLNRR